MYVREEFAPFGLFLIKSVRSTVRIIPSFSISKPVRFSRRRMTMHLMKEEAVLFPYIFRMEESFLGREPVPPRPRHRRESHLHDGTRARLRR